MAFKPKILAFAGSTRKDSYNKKLLSIAVDGAKSAGAEVTVIDLRDYPMPLYDGDLEDEKGLPENALLLKELMAENQGLLIASPEYNSSISGVLKNSIDWVSRKASKDEPALSSYSGKVAALMSASLGGLGGLRGLMHLRAILQNIKVMVIPAQECISSASGAFNENGLLFDKKKGDAVVALGTELVNIVSLLHRETAAR